MSASPHDAILVVSFGGPEGPEEVVPFLRAVTGGRIPAERLQEVAAHYHLFGGRSPINDHCRTLVSALEAELAARGPRLPVYWGNRNWHPFLPEVVGRMRDDGVRRALAFVTSAYGSYPACRIYMDALERARAEVGEGAPELDKLRLYFDHPGFVEPMVDRVREARARFADDRRDAVRLVCTAHSVPLSMERGSPYRAQLEATSALVAHGAGFDAHDLVWQSRSGPPSVPWLEPDVRDHLRTLAAGGVRDVLVAPVGFVSDHMEIVYDLDHEARALAAELGLGFERAATVGDDPRFVGMIRELVLERTGGGARRALSSLGPAPDRCAPGCCPAPAPRR